MTTAQRLDRLQGILEHLIIALCDATSFTESGSEMRTELLLLLAELGEIDDE